MLAKEVDTSSPEDSRPSLDRTSHRHKEYRQKLFRLHSPLPALCYHHKALNIIDLTHGDDHSAAIAQLGEKRRRDMPGCTGDDDPVKWCFLCC